MLKNTIFKKYLIAKNFQKLSHLELYNFMVDRVAYKHVANELENFFKTNWYNFSHSASRLYSQELPGGHTYHEDLESTIS